MANFLEDLVVQWYEFNGYFVRRNVRVGRRPEGGYEAELDVVAFNPETRKLVHIEPSMDTNTWAKREDRYSKKFAAGRKHIPGLFVGIDLPIDMEQIAIFGWVRTHARMQIAGGSVLPMSDFMAIIKQHLLSRNLASEIVPEGFPLLRALHFAAHDWTLRP